MIFGLDEEIIFPPANLANEDGLICIGGDLKPERVLLAYRSGIFPWADDPILWFAPKKRMIIDLNNWQPSKSLMRTFKKKIFDLKIDTNFRSVMEWCADTRDSTWISEDFIDNYTEIHQMGLAHSFEIYQNDELVGGLYGISIGSAFFGESMFHLVTDASKIAFTHLVFFLRHHHFTLLDCQVKNTHLIRMGGIEISQKKYMAQLEEALENKTIQENWRESLLPQYLKTL